MKEELVKAMELVDKLNKATSEYEKIDKAHDTVKAGTICIKTDNVYYPAEDLLFNEAEIKKIILKEIEEQEEKALETIRQLTGSKKPEKECPREMKLKNLHSNILDKETVQKMLEEGHTQKDIAERYNVTQSLVSKFVKDNNIRHNGKKHAKKKEEKKVELVIPEFGEQRILDLLYKDKMTVTQIAQKLDTTKAILHKYMLDHNIVTPRYN